MRNTIVIYHANCPDGFGAAWAAWKKFGDSADYVAASYGEDPPDVSGRRVLIVDFSYRRNVLVEMAARATSLTVLDHHESAMNDLAGLGDAEGISVTFDMERSGCGITWDVLHPNEPRPWFIDYAEDRDLWRLALPDSQKINSYISGLPREFEAWDAMTGMDPERARERGEIAHMTKMSYIESVRDKIRMIEFDGKPLMIINAHQWGISDLLNDLLESHPLDEFVMGFFMRGDGSWQYSLRSREGGVNVARIAERFGGGGHPTAAGFESDKLPWELT